MKRPLILLFSCLSVPAWAQHSVSVHVFDSNQKPLPNAQVALRIWGEKMGCEETLHTDPTGTATFSLAGAVDPAKPVGSVTVHANSFALASQNIKSDSLDFKLQPGVIWRGVVVDQAGNALPNAKVQVRLTRSQTKGGSYIVLTGDELQRAYSTTSGPDGTFQIADLPAESSVSYGTTLAHFAYEGGNSVPVDQSARIALLPGATVRGRLLGLNGKPLPDVRVFAQPQGIGMGYGEAKTAADGTFAFETLKADKYNVMVDWPNDAPYIVPAIENVVADPTTPLQLPDVQAVEGVLVSGVIRDKDSGQPVPGAAIGVYGPARPRTSAAITASDRTEADGHFSIRVAPGENYLYITQTPEGYARQESGQTLLIDKKAPAPLEFLIQKAPVLTGTIVDENNRFIKAQLQSWGGVTINSDAQGRWSFQPQNTGPLAIAGGEEEDGYFELLSAKQLQLPAPDPIVVRVKKHPWQTLEGRVVSRDNAPLAGVEVQATYFFEIGDDGALSQTVRTAKTDAQGHYVLTQVRGDDKTDEIGKSLKVSVLDKNFAFVKGGDVSANGPGWAASDLVLASINGRIEGQTEPNARVVAGGLETKADATGHFAFQGLPEGETLVCAAANGKFGSVMGMAGQGTEPVRIELSPLHAQEVDPVAGRAAWLEVSQEGTGTDFYALNWVNSQLLSPNGETFESLKRPDNAPTTQNSDWGLASQLAKWAPKIPAENRVAQLESIAHTIGTPEIRLTVWLDCAIESNDPKVAQRALEEADSVLPTAPPEFIWREWNLYRIAVATQMVDGEAAGTKALNQAMTWTRANHPSKPHREHGMDTDPSQDQMFKAAASIVASGSEPMLRQLLAAINPESGENVGALAEAIPVVARKRGIEAALPLLEELRNLPKPATQEGNRVLNNDSQWAFNQTARRLIAPLGEKSPERALALAQRVSDKEGHARALATAAQFQTLGEAAKLWREAVENASSADAPRFAAQAWEHDQKLGVELFDVARRKISTTDTSIDGRSAWPAYDFYLARVDAATARLDLEREWGAQMSKGGESAVPIAMAMSAVDGKRALEMARALPKGKDNFWPLEARRKIGQYLMASAEQRRDFPFDRWSATDTWQPGDQEW